MAEPDFSLWLPRRGDLDLQTRRVMRAVEEYDEQLRFARNERNGDWVVTLGEGGIPVFGFGRELPHADEVPRILAKHDIARHGKKIMDALARDAERKRLDGEYRYSETTGEVAEVMESAMHRLGGTPYKRSLRKQDPKHRD